MCRQPKAPLYPPPRTQQTQAEGDTSLTDRDIEFLKKLRKRAFAFKAMAEQYADEIDQYVLSNGIHQMVDDGDL